jgi:hypothetical protein
MPVYFIQPTDGGLIKIGCAKLATAKPIIESPASLARAAASIMTSKGNKKPGPPPVAGN